MKEMRSNDPAAEMLLTIIKRQPPGIRALAALVGANQGDKSSPIINYARRRDVLQCSGSWAVLLERQTWLRHPGKVKVNFDAPNRELVERQSWLCHSEKVKVNFDAPNRDAR